MFVWEFGLPIGRPSKRVLQNFHKILDFYFYYRIWCLGADLHTGGSRAGMRSSEAADLFLDLRLTQ